MTCSGLGNKFAGFNWRLRWKSEASAVFYLLASIRRSAFQFSEGSSMKRISLFFTTLLIGLLGSQAVLAQTQNGATSSSVGATPLTDAQIAVNQDNYAAWDVPEQAIGPNHRTTFRTTKAGQHEIEEIGTGM